MQLTSMHLAEWANEAFSVQWWMLLALHLIILLAWWVFLDKKELSETCLYAGIVMFFVLGLVEYGEELLLWEYPVDILPVFPPLSAVKVFLLPFCYSLLYQKYKTWKSFLVAVLIATSVICFVIEPLIALGGLYQLVHWQYYFNPPLYAAIALLSRLIITKIMRASGKRIADEAEQ